MTPAEREALLRARLFTIFMDSPYSERTFAKHIGMNRCSLRRLLGHAEPKPITFRDLTIFADHAGITVSKLTEGL